MAITVLQGTFTGSSTTPAVDIRTMLATQFGALGGNWSVVDNGYTNSTSVRTVINNSAGFSIMLLTSTTTTDTTLNLYIGSDYNTSTHTLNNIGFGNATTGTTFSANASGYSGVNYNPTAIGTGSVSTLPGYASYQYIPAQSAQTNWVIVYDTTYAIVGIKDGTSSIGKWFYIGAYDSLVANGSISDTYPYCLSTNYTAGSVNSGCQMLNVTSSNSGITAFWGHVVLPFAPNFIGAPGTTGYNDKFSATPTSSEATPIYLVRSVNDKKALSTPAATAGWIKGKLKDIVYTDYLGSAWGDTTTIGSSNYMYIGGISSTVTNTTTNTLSGWVRIS